MACTGPEFSVALRQIAGSAELFADEAYKKREKHPNGKSCEKISLPCLKVFMIAQQAPVV